ncbi:hypothetical protein D9M69_455080 [compost metagenome]
MQARRRRRSRHRHPGEEGPAHAALRRAPADRRQAAGLGRQLRADELRRRRRDGRAGPRRARLRLRPQVRPADQAGDPHRCGRRNPGPLAGRLWRARPTDQLRRVRRPGLPGRLRRHRSGPAEERPRPGPHPVPPARLGHQPPALLGLPDPDHPLPELWRRTGAGRPTAGGAAGRRGAGRRRQPAGEDARVLQLHLPEMRHGGQARNRHHGHLRGKLLVLRPLCFADLRQGHGRPGRGQPLAAGGPVHRRHRTRHPAPALRALLPQADARRGPGQLRRAVQEPADPRHGGRRDLLPHQSERQQGLVQPGRRGSRA